MQRDPLLSTLKDAGLLKPSRISALDKTLSLSFCRDLLHELERVSEEMPQPQTDVVDGLHLIGSGQLQLGNAMPCSALACRMPRTEMAARWAALYADTIWTYPLAVQNIVQLADRHYWKTSRQSIFHPLKNLQDDLKCLALIWPLVNAGIVHSLPYRFYLCEEHSGQLDSSIKQLARGVLSSVGADGYVLWKRASPDTVSVEYNLPILEVGHPLYMVFKWSKSELDREERHFSRVGKKQKTGIKVMGSEITELGLIRSHIEDWTRELLFKFHHIRKGSGLHLGTDSSIDWRILSERKESQPARSISKSGVDLRSIAVERSLQVPYVRDLPLEDVLALRHKHQRSWSSLRRRLRKVARSVETSPGNADALWEVAMGDLEEESEELQGLLGVRKSKDRKAATTVALGSGLIGTLFVYLGGGSAAVSGLISGLSACTAVFGGKEILDSHAVRAESAIKPAYFLLKAREKVARSKGQRH